MKRRDFSLRLTGAGIGLALNNAARAQGGPVEGQQFLKLQTPVPVNLPTAQKKVEVIEFFWYGCTHCFAFEPTLQAWARRTPPDVYFHQVPYAGLGPVEHQKLFYALEELGQREALQPKIFSAIHVERKRLNSESDIGAFLTANGVDGRKFSDAFKSFSVNTRLTRGRQLAAGYKVDSVPMLGINGRYVTSPTLAGSSERAVLVVDFLIQRARQTA